MLLRGLLAILILCLIEFCENAVALIDTRYREGAALGIECGMEKKIAIVQTSRCPYWTMVLGDGEVGAAGARALGAQYRIGAAVAAKARGTLPSVDAIPPIAHAEPHVGLTQNEVDIFLHTMTFGGAVLVGLAWGIGGFAATATFGPTQWSSMAFLGAFGGALTFLLWSYALERTTPTRVAVSVTVNPIVSAIFGVCVPNEPITMNLMIGLVLVAIGIAFATSNR
jgi:uncharacterized membrane protein